MNRKPVKLIVMTGPESSGKTVLGKTLSEHMKVPFVHEQARGYLSGRSGPYEIADIIEIGMLQSRAIEEALGQSPEMVIVDTWIYVLIVWAKIRFGRIPRQFVDWKSKFSPALHILCRPDFPWRNDPLREHPLHREALFSFYQNLLLEDRVPYYVAEGPEATRLFTATEKVKKLLEEPYL